MYNTLMEINRKEVFGEDISSQDKELTVSTFLNGMNRREDVRSFKHRMRVNVKTDVIYPNFFIPPCNGYKKLRLVQGYLPKTNILYANHYELEILRLANMFAPDNEMVAEMTQKTIQRLKKTCFGNSCTQGECFSTGISVLRFLAIARPYDVEWIDKLLTPLGDSFLSFKNGQNALPKELPLTYLLMAFADINNRKTRDLINARVEWLIELLRKGKPIGKSSNGKVSTDETYLFMGKYIIRNAIATLPAYEDISKHAIYVDEKHRRCYCNI